MKLKQMALGTVLLSGLVSAAYAQRGPQRDNHNNNHTNNSRPVNLPNDGFERGTAPRQSAPAPRPTNTDQHRTGNDPRPWNPPQGGFGQRPSQNDNRRNGNQPQSYIPRTPVQNPVRPNNWTAPRNNDNGGFQRGPVDTHHTGIQHPPVHVGGTIRYQNPNHGQGWRNDYRNDYHGRLSFGLYLFGPTEACYVSPWYDYGALPGYVEASSVIAGPSDNCQWNEGSVYSYGDVALDQTVTSLQSLFINQNMSPLDNLLPDNGSVGIYTDGGYDYSVDSNEFQQMLTDNVTNVDTVGYRVTQIRKDGNQAIVKAQHTVTDPDGGEDVVYQLFRLQYEDGRYVITDFMTSHNAV